MRAGVSSDRWLSIELTRKKDQMAVWNDVKNYVWSQKMDEEQRRSRSRDIMPLISHRTFKSAILSKPIITYCSHNPDTFLHILLELAAQKRAPRREYSAGMASHVQEAMASTGRLERRGRSRSRSPR